jgi:hypothetical protein
MAGIEGTVHSLAGIESIGHALTGMEGTVQVCMCWQVLKKHDML